jgi:hypothetical protein
MAEASMNVNGTFTATGNSAEITGSTIIVKLNFGTGTVTPQIKMPDGTFIAVPDSSDVTDYTADDVIVLGGANYPEETYRLNCSAYTADIDYAMSAI